MKDKIERVKRLKREKGAVILAHYYVEDAVQEVADYVGDSFFLSQIATKVEAQTIVLCGVRFMGESAKILNPGKTVLLPDAQADCPMAHMATPERIRAIRETYDDVAVVCYINSTAELKTLADVCVTSSNALKICKALPNKYIYFIPDQHLAHFIAAQLPEKHFLFNDGYCLVHNAIRPEGVRAAKAAHPNAKVLAHPECSASVTALADYVGSTSGIISFAEKDDAKSYIVCTEKGVFYELRNRCPDKQFFPAQGSTQCCVNMKKVTLDKVISALETGAPAVELDPDFAKAAYTPLQKMLELSQ